jgi:hypothetical protein
MDEMLEKLAIRKDCLPNGIQEGILAARSMTFLVFENAMAK